jgi:Na+-transporting NADH:ubiquinone oxidoreductase subunit NqrD
MDSALAVFESTVLSFGQWLKPYLYNISLLLVVCLVSLYANDIIKVTKRFVARRHFFVRVAVFVLVTGFGFGFLVVFATPLLCKLLLLFGTQWLGLMVICAFTVLGVIADKKNQL